MAVEPIAEPIYDEPDRAGGGLKSAIVLFGVLAAVFVGGTLLFTLGTAAAVAAVVILLLLAVVGLFLRRNLARVVLSVEVALALGSIAFLGWAAYSIFTAFTDTEGPVAPADPVALASAEAKLDAVDDAAAFRLELTEEEMTAYLLDALADNEDNPVESVVLDVVDRAPGEQGIVEFDLEFKGGGIDGSGAFTATVEAGAVEIELLDVGVGAFEVPGVAAGALEDVIDNVADLNEALANAGADVQSVDIGNDRVVVVGTQISTDLITSDVLLAGLRDSAAAAINAVSPPPERLGRGTAGALPGPLHAPVGGPPFVVALGDSLAANVGVVDARDGYVARLHAQLQERDAEQYGLRNFGVSGETTGTLIRTGQLDAAVDFLERNDTAYVTIDIGANNLLGHLGSEDCSVSLSAPACRSRLDTAFARYPADLDTIFGAIREAAPDAVVVFMLAYNPFSLGLSTDFEAESDAVLSAFNDLAVAAAAAHDVTIADAFTPMQGTTAATTHMLDAMPDIHPVEIGFDILACSFLEALGATCPVA